MAAAARARTFTHIVVGAGTGGCLVARRLADTVPGARVLLLEAGGTDRHRPWFHVPVGYLYCIGNPRADWMLNTEPVPGLGGRALRYPRGKTLGGCSAINGMIYMRGQSRDYDRWAEATREPAWSWREALPLMKRHEAHWAHRESPNTPHATVTDGDPDAAVARPGVGGGVVQRCLHGKDGELRVNQQRLRWPVLDAVEGACVDAGIPRTADFNAGDNNGVGYFDVTQHDGWRWSSASAFLPADALRNGSPDRPLTVLTDARATRVNIAAGTTRVEGVTVARRGMTLDIGLEPGGEVVLCAGAVHTPQLLMVSGIGPAAHLKSVGVQQVLIDSPHVGEHLQDHLQLRTIFRLTGDAAKGATLNSRYHSWIECAKMAYEYARYRRGPLAMAPSQLGAFTRSSDAEPHTNIEFHIQPLSLDAFGEPLHDFDAVTMSVCNLNPMSEGTLRLRSSNIADAPLIQPNYLATERDRAVAADSIRVVRRVMAQQCLAHLAPVEHLPGADVASEEALRAAAGRVGSTIFHPTCTCRMGADPAESVVDPHLRVRGVDGLRIADASVMPQITSGNTNAPVLLIAERLAEWMAADVARR